MKMKIIMAALVVTMLAATPARAVHVSAQVTLAPLGRSYSPPPLGRKQGWLVISNRDWMDYTMNIDYKDNKLYLYKQGQGWGSVHIPSGTTITLALEKDTWRLYGDNSDRLRVRVREGRTTTLALEPFGFVGNTGLIGIVNDGSNTRSETLFNVYSQPIVVQPPPAIIVEQPPPPIIVTRPPVYRPPYHRPPAHRPPPPPRPRGRRDGWGFSLFFD